MTISQAVTWAPSAALAATIIAFGAAWGSASTEIGHIEKQTYNNTTKIEELDKRLPVVDDRTKMLLEQQNIMQKDIKEILRAVNGRAY